jgi:hypothetical protein
MKLIALLLISLPLSGKNETNYDICKNDKIILVDDISRDWDIFNKKKPNRKKFRRKLRREAKRDRCNFF